MSTYITKAAIENVQWAIIFCRLHIFNIILHFHFNTISFIILTAFKFLVTIFFNQSWQRPFFIGFPIRLQIKMIETKTMKSHARNESWRVKEKLRHIFL